MKIKDIEIKEIKQVLSSYEYCKGMLQRLNDKTDVKRICSLTVKITILKTLINP